MKRSASPRKRRPGVRRGPSSVAPEKWRNPKYLQFLRDNGVCAICQYYICEPAHGPVTGMSSKGPDAEAVPLCRIHHAHMHHVGWSNFECEFGISREAVAEQWWKQFMLECK